MTRRAPDFGHHSAHSLGCFLDAWGDGPLVIRDGKRVWWFEFSDMFGPLVLKPGGTFEPADKQPTDERDPFWRPFQGWMRSGKRCRAVTTKRGRMRFYLCHWNREEQLE